MKALLNHVRGGAIAWLALSISCVWFPSARAQTDLPYSSGSTGADGPLTFRTIPVGGRYGHSLAYDATRNQTILFGGYNPNIISGGYLADTWAFDGNNWVRLAPATNPPRRAWGSMVYVPWNGGRIVLFGGQDLNGQNLNDTWMWDGTTWTQVNTASSPGPRFAAAIAYDAERDKVMIYSGSGGGTETWLFDGTTWTLPGVQNPPPQWDQHIATYDTERKKVVLVSYDGTWLWDGATWTKANPQNPVQRGGHGGLAFDPVRKVVVKFGGENTSSTYEWNGVDWTVRNPVTVPPTVYSTQMIYDSARGKITMFGGQVPGGDSFTADTWTWNGTNWTFVSGRNEFFDMSGRANGIWNYTTINIPPGINVNFIKNSANTPVRWLAQGNVQVDGNLVLDGGVGGNSLPEGVGGAGGPGAFDGGHGAIRSNRSGSNVGSPGQGPGGGLPGTQPTSDRDGKAGLFATSPGGYGNIYLQPLIGGSGGGGGSSSDIYDGGNGSGGGGAILIASSRDIIINGGIYSRSGTVEYSNASYGGRGSGGAILLRADRIGGSGVANAAPDGRIRFEAYFRTLAGSTDPTSVNSAPVASGDFNSVGSLSILSVKGVNVAQPPSGNQVTPDVIFTDAGPVSVVVQGSNVPNGTPVQLRIATASGIISPPAQNINNNSVTFNVTVPKGLGTLQAFATFTINN